MTFFLCGRNILAILCAYSPQLLNLRSTASLLASHKCYMSNVTWKALAYAYTTPPDFWSLAMQRPERTSRPLRTWKEELKRIVIFKQKCLELDFKVDDAFIMYYWTFADQAQSPHVRLTSRS